MNCFDVQPWINLPKEEIPVHLRQEIHHHIVGCPPCRQDSKEYESLDLKLRALPAADPGETFWRRFPEQVRKELTRAQKNAEIPDSRWIDRGRWFSRTLFPPFAAAAGVAALTLGAILLFNRVELPQMAFVPNEEDLAALDENLDLSIEAPMEPDDLPTLVTWGSVNGGTAGYYDGLQNLAPEDLDSLDQQLQEDSVPS